MVLTHQRLRVTAWLLAVLVCAACSSQKKPAEAAFAQLQASIEPVSAELERYAPDEYAQLVASMDELKAKLNAKDYQAVLDLSSTALTQLKAASSTAAKQKQALAKQAAGDWKTLSVVVPKAIAEISTRIDELRLMKQLPNGIVMESVNQAEAALPTLNARWSAVMADYKGNKLDSALSKALELQQYCTRIAASLGLRW